MSIVFLKKNISEWVSDFLFNRSEQVYSYVMTRTSYFW